MLCFALIYAYATAGFICFPGKFAFDNSGALPALTLASTTLTPYSFKYPIPISFCTLRRDAYTFLPEVESGDTDVYNVNSAHCDTLWKCLLVSIDQARANMRAWS